MTTARDRWFRRGVRAGAPRSWQTSRRNALRAVSTLALAPVVLAGCSPFAAPMPRQWYRLDDLAEASVSAGSASPIERVLLIEGVSSGAIHEGSALVYARSRGVFGHYRFANWTETPVNRVAALVEHRLSQRGRFSAVGASTSGLRPGLLLRVGIVELFLDASQTPGVARVALDAELIDWSARQRLARRRFDAGVPLRTEDAAATASAMSQGLTEALDALAVWVEAAAAR